jgi:hypothetical protein
MYLSGSDAHQYAAIHRGCLFPALTLRFLLFNQSPEFATQTVVDKTTTSVSHFSISEFASAVGLGNPIAGTFMLAAPDQQRLAFQNIK